MGRIFSQIPKKPNSKRKIILISIIIILVLGTIGIVFTIKSKSASFLTNLGTKTSIPIQTSSLGKTATTRPATSVNIQSFEIYKCVDNDGAGSEAFSILVPKGWQSEGTVRWILDRPGIPAEMEFQTKNPSSSEEFHIFPLLVYFWTDDPLTLSIFPQGSSYYGQIMFPPIDAQTGLREVVIPKYRSGASIREISDVPEVATALKSATNIPGVSTTVTSAKAKIEYQESGKNMEEEFYASVIAHTVNLTGVNNTFWNIGFIYSFKAEKGKLATNSKLFQTILKSFTLNQNWYAKYLNVVEYLTKQEIKRIQALGEVSRMMAVASSQMREDQQRSWEVNQEVKDRISQNFSNYILDIQRYHDPNSGGEVELPAGYGHAWANRDGQYLVTDDPNFNPNQDFKNYPGSWTELQAVK